MATNLLQQVISTWRQLDIKGELSKAYTRYDKLDRVIERIATKETTIVGGSALRYTCGYIEGDYGDIKSELYEIVLWTDDLEKAINGIQTDGTFIPV